MKELCLSITEGLLSKSTKSNGKAKLTATKLKDRNFNVSVEKRKK